MSTKTKPLAAFVLGLVIGAGACAGAAYWCWYRPAAELAAGTFTTVAGRSLENIALLRRLQTDDVAGVSRLIENQLTADALTLSLHAGATTAGGRDPILCKAAAAIREYRISHPDPAMSEATWAAIRNGLPTDCQAR